MGKFEHSERTREGQEIVLDSYARLQHDGRRQRAVREGIVAGLSMRNYRRAVESVLDGYGIEKSSVSREFVQASAAQLQQLCERKLGGLDLVAILIDGIHFGQQVLVVALGTAPEVMTCSMITSEFPVRLNPERASEERGSNFGIRGNVSEGAERGKNYEGTSVLYFVAGLRPLGPWIRLSAAEGRISCRLD